MRRARFKGLNKVQSFSSLIQEVISSLTLTPYNCFIEREAASRDAAMPPKLMLSSYVQHLYEVPFENREG